MTVVETMGLILAGVFAFLFAVHITLFVTVLAFGHSHEAMQRWHRKFRAVLDPTG